MNSSNSINNIKNNDQLTKIQEIRADIVHNAQFEKAFIVMNALAAIIASYALLAGSVSGVIGAMLVAMLLGPIAGLSLSLVDGDYLLFKQSAISLIGGIGIVIFCSFIIGFIHDDMPVSTELLARTRPNYLDLMIALAGGAVGAYAVITPRIPNPNVGVTVNRPGSAVMCRNYLFSARQLG